MRPGTEMFLNADRRLTETGQISRCPADGGSGNTTARRRHTRMLFVSLCAVARGSRQPTMGGLATHASNTAVAI